MKVQDVRKECLATIGLSVEFTNLEVSSLSHLLTVVQNAVDDGIKQARTVAKTIAKATERQTEKQYGDNEKIEVSIDLKSLKRIEWLLMQLTRKETSGLFELADKDYRVDLDYINGLKSGE